MTCLQDVLGISIFEYKVKNYKIDLESRKKATDMSNFQELGIFVCKVDAVWLSSLDFFI